MSFFIFPQGWIAPAIAAAAISFGSIGSPTVIEYRNLPGKGLGEAYKPNTIVIDKKPASQWTRQKAQCVIAHEYAHLAGRKHSENPRSIMSPVLTYEACMRWLKRRGLE